MTTRASLLSPLVLFSFAAAEPAPSCAEERAFALGLRVNVMTGDGEPTNDVPGFGLFGHLPVNDRWNIGFALDHSPEFDVERTAKIVGFEQSGEEEEEIDSKGSSTTLTVWIERVYGEGWQWLWGIGAGISDVEVDPLEGIRPDGSPFRVETEAGTEALLIASAGFRNWFGGRKWAFSTEIRLEQRWASWELREVRRGETAKIDDYLLSGVHFGLSRRF
jgi:hypothetical protein